MTRTAAALAASIALSGFARAGEADRLLQKAFYAEAAENDLDAAIAGYREILAMPGLDAPIAARANLRLGSCLAAKGRRAEAAKHLRRALELGGERIRAEAEKLLADVEAFTPADAMPPEPLLYVEFDSPGEQFLQLAAVLDEADLIPPGRLRAFIANPTFIEEVRKIRSVAATITGGEAGRPTGVAVVVLEKRSAIQTILRLLIPAGAERRAHGGVEIWQVQGARGELSVAFREDLIILGHPAAEVEAALDRLGGGAPSLAESPPFLLATARYRVPGSLVAYTDGSKLLATLAAIQPPRPEDRVGARMLEVERLGSLAVRAIFADALAIEGEARFRGGMPRLARILRTPPVDPSILAWLPADAAIAAAASIGDGAAAWDEFLRFAEETHDAYHREGVGRGDRPAAALARLEAELGFRIGDALAAIDSIAIGARTPGKGWEDPPVVALKVKDPEAAGPMARAFLAWIGRRGTGRAVAIERDVSEGVAVEKVRISERLEPAFALAGRTLVLGFAPDRVRRAIAAGEAGGGILAGAKIPEGAAKLAAIRPSAMARVLSGRDAEGWRLLADAIGDAPLLVWTEEEEGRIAVKANVPDLPGILVKIAERTGKR